MNSLELNQRLAPVHTALNNIKVSGKDDLNNLLGAIMVIESILQETIEDVKNGVSGDNAVE